jgi:YrhK-like protein
MRTAARAPLRVPKTWLAEEHSKVGPFVTRETYRLEDGSRRRWSSRRHRKGHERLTARSVFWQPRALGWWIAVLFAIGSFLFALGVVPPYAAAVGAVVDAWTFFVGSLFFTSAGYLQFVQAINAPPDVGVTERARFRLFAWEPHRIDFWACGIQSLGTLWFNWSTFAATRSALDAEQAHKMIWRPDLLGSIAFIVASWLAWVEVCHRWFAWRPRDVSWWIVAANLAGSIAFLISAFAAYIDPETGTVWRLPLANLGTFVGAVGFFVGALLLIPEMRSASAEA